MVFVKLAILSEGPEGSGRRRRNKDQTSAGSQQRCGMCQLTPDSSEKLPVVSRTKAPLISPGHSQDVKVAWDLTPSLLLFFLIPRRVSGAVNTLVTLVSLSALTVHLRQTGKTQLTGSQQPGVSHLTKGQLGMSPRCWGLCVSAPRKVSVYEVISQEFLGTPVRDGADLAPAGWAGFPTPSYCCLWSRQLCPPLTFPRTRFI